jgi:tetratricopeptide (TPR) repeat protein
MEWDWSGAKADIDRALELDPEDVEAIRAASRYAYMTGHPQEAAALGKKALEKDPLDGSAWNFLAVAYQVSGRFEEAERAYARALEVDPRNAFAAGNRCWMLLDAGRQEEGFPACAAAAKDVWMACAYHAVGQDAKSREILDGMLERKKDPFGIAWVYGCRGRADETFEWLERARVGHLRVMGEVKAFKEFRPLHSDPRWAELMRKMNLPVD